MTFFFKDVVISDWFVINTKQFPLNYLQNRKYSKPGGSGALVMLPG